MKRAPPSSYLIEVSNGSEDALIAQLSQRNNLSPIEARTMLYNQVSLIKETIASNGKYALDGIGEIIEFDNSYQILEEKKSLFPSDFFGMSSFDFTENKTSTDFYSEAEKMKVEQIPMVEHTSTITPEPVREEKKVVVEEIISEVPIRSDLDSFIEESKQKMEEVESTPKEETPSLFSDLVAKVKKTTKKKKEEPSKEESLFNAIMEEEPIVEEVATPEEIIVPEEAPVEEIEEKEEIAPLEIVEEAETIEEPIEEEVITEVEEILPEIIEEPEIEPAEIVRRNIGRANYDEGYYEHLVSNKSNKSEAIRLGRVLPIVAALAILAFFIPWIVASFQGKHFLGMNPLFNSKKKSDIKKIAKTAPILDTAKRDSLATTKMDSTPISNKDTVAKIITPAPAKTVAATTPTKPNTTTSVSPVVEKPKSGIASKPSITKTQNENTPPKTMAGVNSPKKQTKKSEVAKATAVKDSTKKTAEVVSIDKKGSTAAKAVIGKPYATANYTKGNTYLNFGSFKIPKNAIKLKRDLNKLGVETDVINVDGTYKVVVSYTNKEKAMAATKDYPNTSVFE